jgi:hypothetical protein
MTQLRRDAAYIRTESPTAKGVKLSAFDERVCDVLSTPHTVISVAKALAGAESAQPSDLESRVADAMHHLLEADRIELSPDS